MSGEARSRVINMGWAYTLGILVSFWVLVAALLLLRYGGLHIGWGFQLQSPQFVFVLASVLFAFALNLLGLFEISGGFTAYGSSLAYRPGYIGSFFTGVLATLVATPCTAPFMGPAIGFALSQSVGGLWDLYRTRHRAGAAISSDLIHPRGRTMAAATGSLDGDL